MATGVGTFLAVVWLIFIGFRQSQGLSLTVKGEECVYEEVEFDGDAISGNFVSVAGIRFWRSRNSGIDFSVFDPMGNIMKKIKGTSGENFKFSAPQSGIYKFCFHNQNSASTTVTFYIHIGHIPTEKEFVKDEHLHSLNVRMAKLKEALESTVNEQRYLRAREARHRKTNESTRQRVIAFTLTEYFALVLVSGAQVYLIRRMFKYSHGFTRV